MADNILQAFQQFNQGLSQFAQTKAVESANQRVNQIKESNANVTQQREQIREVANDLTQALSATGLSPAGIKQQVQSFLPQEPKTLQEIQVAAAFGDEKARDGLNFIEQMRSEQRREEARIDLENKTKLLFLKKQLLGKSQQKRQLTPAQIEKLSELDTSFVRINEMMDRVTNNTDLVGPIAGRDPSRQFLAERADFDALVGRFFDEYKKKITGTAASAKEMEMLKQNLPKVTEPPEVFKRKLKTVKEIGQEVFRRKLGTLEKFNFVIPEGAFLADSPYDIEGGVNTIKTIKRRGVKGSGKKVFNPTKINPKDAILKSASPFRKTSPGEEIR